MTYRSVCSRHGVLIAESWELSHHVDVILKHFDGCFNCKIREVNDRIYNFYIRKRSDRIVLEPYAGRILIAPSAADWPAYFTQLIELFNERNINESR